MNLSRVKNEKATKIDKITLSFVVSNDKSSDFMAFSEYMNFKNLNTILECN